MKPGMADLSEPPVREHTTFVYVVTLPSDDHTERYVFGDMGDAYRVRDAVEGAQCIEEPILDSGFATFLVDRESDDA